MGEILIGRKTRKELLLLLIKVDLVKHEFAGLLIVGKLVDDCEVVRCHILVV
jgi:hypothetical protein